VGRNSTQCQKEKKRKGLFDVKRGDRGKEGGKKVLPFDQERNSKEKQGLMKKQKGRNKNMAQKKQLHEVNLKGVSRYKGTERKFFLNGQEAQRSADTPPLSRTSQPERKQHINCITPKKKRNKKPHQKKKKKKKTRLDFCAVRGEKSLRKPPYRVREPRGRETPNSQYQVRAAVALAPRTQIKGKIGERGTHGVA